MGGTAGWRSCAFVRADTSLARTGVAVTSHGHAVRTGGGTVLKQASLGLAIVGTLGLATGPNSALTWATSGSEAVSALVTGAVLLLLAAAARRSPARKD